MEFKSKVGKPWYEVVDHLDRKDVMLLLMVVLNNYFLFRESSTNNYTVLQLVLHVYQWWQTEKWSILKGELWAQSYPCHSQLTPGLVCG